MNTPLFVVHDNGLNKMDGTKPSEGVIQTALGPRKYRTGYIKEDKRDHTNMTELCVFRSDNIESGERIEVFAPISDSYKIAELAGKITLGTTCKFILTCEWYDNTSEEVLIYSHNIKKYKSSRIP